MTGVRSFLLFESEYEIDISRFKDRVSMPSPSTEYELAIDATIIRKILNACNNRRLKPFLYVLATSGLRAMEAMTLRLKDVELSQTNAEPSIIHVRKEYSKTRRPRDVFISSEATEYLKQWLDYKYRKRARADKAPEKKPEDIIFSYGIGQNSIASIDSKLREGFIKILETVRLDDRKEGMLRRKITFHSFRRFVKTTLSDKVGSDFAEYILGHKRDMGYYTMTPTESTANYKKAMSYLTFTDYSALDARGKSIEDKLDQKDLQIAELTKKFEELKQLATEEFEELKEGDRVYEKFLTQLGKNGTDFFQWLKENDKKNILEKETILKQRDFDYEIAPGGLDKEGNGILYVKKAKKGIIQEHQVKRKTTNS